VWGVIYLCNPEAIKKMDKREGVAEGHYHHINVEVFKDDGEKVSAMTYKAGSDKIELDGKPSKEYLRKQSKGQKIMGSLRIIFSTSKI
jgi:cation transport regulator ChaC